VVRAVESKENGLRFHDRLSEREFDDLNFSTYLFRSGQLEHRRAEEIRSQLIAASFTAWQMLTAQGLKQGWNEYLSLLGLSESDSMGREAGRRMADKAITIAERIRRSRRGA
jgi:hypothetical protein